MFSLSVSVWELLGSIRFVGLFNSGNYLRIRLDVNDVLWVIFVDILEYNGSVMKFNGIDWEYVGNKNIVNGDIYYIDIIFDSNNILYIFFVDEGNLGRLRVLSFNGSNWNDVGLFILSGLGFYFNLVFDNNGVLYVVYNDSNFSNKVVLKKYNGVNWVRVGVEGFLLVKVVYIDFVFDSINMFYVLFRDFFLDFISVLVMLFDGLFWEYVGKVGVLNVEGNYMNIVIDSKDNILLSIKIEIS